jgi:protein-disulfide isomerase
VRLIFREFPIGHSAGTAALAARCVSDKDYFRVVEKFFATQSAWVAQEVKTDEIYKVVQSAGLARGKFDACLANQNMNDALALVKQRGREFGVTGTPTFFVNGTKVAGSVTFEDMQAVIDAALAARQSAGQAGAPPSPRTEPERQAAGV